MPIKREEIVKETISWIGTPFHHQESLKGVGTDCYGLLLGICKNLNIAQDHIPIKNYSRMPNGYMDTLLVKHLIKVPMDERKAGDIVNFAWGRSKLSQHLGILIDTNTVVHAYGNDKKGKVVKTPLTGRHLKALRGVWRFHEVED